MKVVINNCYGGFGLSKEGAKLLIKLGFDDPDFIKLIEKEDKYPSYYPHIQRHDSRLIEVVETLGDKGFGSFAELKVVEVKGNLYRINEYDGWESVETPYNIDWINGEEL